MRTFARAALPLLLGALAASGLAQPRLPFEREGDAVPATPIDEAVVAGLRAAGLEPARPCSDEVFLRRLFVDALGMIPSAEEARAFLADTRPGKRQLAIDAALSRPEYADYWAMKWCDVLRVKAEFPINLWPDAAQSYHRWIRDAIASDMPYDRFARELLTASGSSFRVPPANFLRAVQGRSPDDLARAVALTFLGSRTEAWSEADRANLAAFFSRVAYKPSGEWKEEIVLLDPAPTGPLDVTFPDGSTARLEGGADPRVAFAEWLTEGRNPWFARALANRVWCWLMGRGVIHEADDIRPDNPPSNPELLACLERTLVESGWDMRALHRAILNSRTWQQSSIPRAESPDNARLSACYPTRRLEAETLSDALSSIGGFTEPYVSMVPEPYTYLPDGQRAVCIADGSITSGFLEMFGRPARDTGLMSERSDEMTDAQRLWLLNSSDIQRVIEASAKLSGAVRGRRGADTANTIYLILLSRYPTADEMAALTEAARSGASQPKQLVEDLAWSLLNSKEFLYRH